MKLNRWKRLGVVISVLWALGAAYYERSIQMESGRQILDLQYNACMETEKSTFASCWAEMDKDFDVWMKPNWGNIAFIVFAPVMIAWILVFIIFRVYQWIKAGET
ncbi:MAG: hypothetical protein CTY10_04605 [Methylotenera sp.]|nr:MAG: hypothetical protein CTY10_04605 [Methylotenera sp.]